MITAFIEIKPYTLSSLCCGVVANAWTQLGINLEGKKDLLGMWITNNEGAKFWLSIVTELKNRGVEDILIASVDGLKGFSEAINLVFPQTVVQRCIIHRVAQQNPAAKRGQIRYSMKYVGSKYLLLAVMWSVSETKKRVYG